MKKILFFFLVMLASTAFSDNISIDVDPGQSRFLVVLPANPSTGYQWSIKGYDHDIINMIHSEYRAGNQQLIGAPGRMFYTFEIVKGADLPATTVISFEYGRPWEQSSSRQPQIVVVNFTLSP